MKNNGLVKLVARSGLPLILGISAIGCAYDSGHDNDLPDKNRENYECSRKDSDKDGKYFGKVKDFFDNYFVTRVTK